MELLNELWDTVNLKYRVSVQHCYFSSFR